MKRRQFLATLAALAATPVLPAVAEPAGNVGLGTATPDYELYISPEAIEQLRAWCIDTIDEQTRREIYATS